MELLRKYGGVVQTGALLLAVRLGLRMVSLPRLLRWLSPHGTGSGRISTAIEHLAHYTDCWLDLFPFNPKGNCFPRALVLYRLARCRGVPAVFHCGVLKRATGLEGHAWLTCGGEPLLEKAAQWKHFTVTFSFPPDSDG